MIRGRFAFQIQGGDGKRFEMAGSEWWLFLYLRKMSKAGQELEWLESYGAPLVPRSLAALNCYLRTRAIRFWHSKRYDLTDGHELLGVPEWQRFCRMLDLKFDGRGTRTGIPFLPLSSKQGLVPRSVEPEAKTSFREETINFRAGLFARGLEP